MKPSIPPLSSILKTGALVLALIVAGVIAGMYTSGNPQAETNAKTVVGFIVVLALAFCGIVFYFLPAVIATSARHHNAGAIAVLNLLLGWTFFGWIVALVWSITARKPTLICPRCKTANFAGSQFCSRCSQRFF